MAKESAPGEMRTRIRIERRSGGRLPGGAVQKGAWEDIFPPCTLVRCKWVNAYGQEALTASTMRIAELATITLRYSPLITPDCRVLRLDEPVPQPYDIISVNNILNEGRWLEIKIKRGTLAGDAAWT